MKNVLITGASTGIGRASALLLARSGYRVFAGVRNPADGESLKKEEPRIDPVILEVTDQGSIAKAFQRVSAEVDGLHALVNNAGIGASAPLEFQDLGEIERVFAINVFGLIKVTQAFLPLIRQGKGRVVNVGSVGDRFTIPFGAALCASKAAVRTMTEALRMELHPFGIHVVLVRPGAIATPAVTKMGDQAGLAPQAEEIYGKLYRSVIERATEKGGSPPEVIAEAIFEAVSASSPRTRYSAGRGSTLLSVLPAVLPDRMLDGVKMLLLGLPLAFGAVKVAQKLKAKAAK